MPDRANPQTRSPLPRAHVLLRSSILAATSCAVLALMGIPTTAGACSDSGVPVPACTPSGTSCESHEDCPSEQRCDAGGSCSCSRCPYEELCEANGCRCAEEGVPSLENGCVSINDSCGGYRGVMCREPDAGTPECIPEALPATPCRTDSDCVGPVELVCGGEGRCACPTTRASDDGCSAHPGTGRQSPAGWLAVAFCMCVASWRRRSFR